MRDMLAQVNAFSAKLVLIRCSPAHELCSFRFVYHLKPGVLKFLLQGRACDSFQPKMQVAKNR